MKICENPKCKKQFKAKRINIISCSSKCAKKTYYLKQKKHNPNYFKNYYLSNKKYLIQKANLHYKNNIDSILEYRKNYYKANKEKCLETSKKSRIKNINEYRKKSLNWKKNNKDKVNYMINKRRSLKITAIPKFANLEKIKEIYKNCPRGYHVDHIIPLNNPIVCGLHVEWNLQYLTAKDNLKKSNKLLDYIATQHI
jgi:hypothetical protein